MATPPSPFTERGRITDPQHFIGRWRELSIIFEKLEARRPVLIAGPAGVGKSSLLTHISQSAATNLERFDLESLFVDLAALPDAAAFYRLVVDALGDKGDTSAALEVALIQHEGPVLLCLDGAEQAIAAGWGDMLLAALARIAR
ncbi:MAG: ATP-binding protein, partial [Chloroflexales bacterium]|nr:ATP-binding protein [Chloroflexales bacterium]